MEFNRAERNVFLWVIGHEVGHIVNGDAPAHFRENRIKAIAAPSSLGQYRKVRADAWFVRQLRSEPKRQREVEVTLLDLLYAQVRAKVGTKHLYPVTGVPITDQLVEYARLGDHPEFVIRATRMLSLSFDRPDVYYMKRQIDQFERILREKGGS